MVYRIIHPARSDVIVSKQLYGLRRVLSLKLTHIDQIMKLNARKLSF